MVTRVPWLPAPPPPPPPRPPPQPKAQGEPGTFITRLHGIGVSTYTLVPWLPPAPPPPQTKAQGEPGTFITRLHGIGVTVQMEMDYRIYIIIMRTGPNLLQMRTPITISQHRANTEGSACLCYCSLNLWISI